MPWTVALSLPTIVKLEIWGEKLNTYAFIVVTPLPIVTLDRLLQYPNANVPMLVTLSGIVILVKFIPANAQFPMLVTLFGISKMGRPVQSLNGPSPILVTLFGMSKLFIAWQLRKAFIPMLVMCVPSSMLSAESTFGICVV